MRNSSVLTIGSATIDTIAVIADDRIERVTMRNAETSFLMLEDGRKTEALEVSTHTGGGAVNAAVAFARLGYTVSTLIKLGRDERANVLLARLGSEGISTRYVRHVDQAPTGASVMVSSHDRNAAIFTYRGANTCIVPEDLDEKALAVDVVFVASLSDNSAQCFPSFIERAKRKGAFVATNPGVRQLSARGKESLDCLPSIDVLIFNQVEAEALVPQVHTHLAGAARHCEIEPRDEGPEVTRRPLLGGGYQMSIPAFLGAIARRGPRFVVLTLGRHGAFMASGGALFYSPAVEAAVAGTAGAGDAFAATLSALLACGVDAETALKSAAYNAASVIGFVDTQSGLLDSATLSARVNRLAVPYELRRWTYGHDI